MNPHSNLVSGAGQDLYRVGANSWLNRDTVADRVGWPLSASRRTSGAWLTALTYEEAQERSRLIDVFGYRIELDVTGRDDMFGSVTVVRFGCRAPGAGTFIEIRPARLRRVVLNGRDVDPAALTGSRLPLSGLLAAPPISTYLFRLVEGPYHRVRTEHQGVSFGLHAR